MGRKEADYLQISSASAAYNTATAEASDACGKILLPPQNQPRR